MKFELTEVEKLIIEYGYAKKQYGYVKKNKNGTNQAVTIFDDGDRFQFFGWNDEYGDNKIYDTGIINLKDMNQLETLLKVFYQYKTL